jgi:hypothetical protein
MSKCLIRFYALAAGGLTPGLGAPTQAAYYCAKSKSNGAANVGANGIACTGADRLRQQRIDPVVLTAAHQWNVVDQVRGGTGDREMAPGLQGV